jgi:membrane-anchored glycerophosphoryl diester phosphodiesterase (GDPDase)
MSLLKILRESFEMLLERPQLFVPRLFSATLSSLAVIGWVTGNLGSLLFLAFFPLITVLGAFTPIIVSSMVKAEQDKNLLRKGFSEALNLWKPILGFALLTIVLGFLASIPASIGVAASYITGNIVYAAVGVSLALLITLLIAFSIYFVPITLLENKGIIESFRESMNTSRDNRKEVLALTFFSFAVLLVSSLVTGRLRDLGLSMFFAGRMISSIVGTYLIVVSPKYYLEEKYGS